MRRFKFRYKETIATIITESEEYFEVAVKAILEARSEIERYIEFNPYFYISYEPLDCEGKIVGRMCKASKIANVGPMASVAGTIASYAVEKMIEEGARIAIVDNGGDIVIHSDREIVVGVYPSNVAFKIEPKYIYAVCTSSGKIGHSVSFGYADAATIFAEDGSIADALATALCNEIKEEFKAEDVKRVVEEFWKKFRKYIDGVFVAKDDIFAFTGNIEFAKAEVKPDLITRG